MFMESMVTEGKMDDLLGGLSENELKKVTMTLDVECLPVPLVTASVSVDRFLEFAQETCAMISRDQYGSKGIVNVINVSAHSEAGEYSMDNVTSLLGIWTDVGEERL